MSSKCNRLLARFNRGKPTHLLYAANYLNLVGVDSNDNCYEKVKPRFEFQKSPCAWRHEHFPHNDGEDEQQNIFGTLTGTGTHKMPPASVITRRADSESTLNDSFRAIKDTPVRTLPDNKDYPNQTCGCCASYLVSVIAFGGICCHEDLTRESG